MCKENWKEATLRALKALYRALPLILGTILLVSLASLIPKTFYTKIFTESFFDTVIGSAIGSISAGNPVSSYILGGEMLSQGISLLAVTAFLVAWVTVGLIQLPAESMIFGKKFAVARNILSFIFAIIISVLTILIYNLI